MKKEHRGRPKKPLKEHKKPVTIRLYNWQRKLLNKIGKSDQGGIDKLIKWYSEMPHIKIK